MTDRCEHCGGFVDEPSCICDLSAKVREKLKEHFGLSDDQLDEAIDQGHLYLIDCGSSSDSKEFTK